MRKISKIWSSVNFIHSLKLNRVDNKLKRLHKLNINIQKYYLTAMTTIIYSLV